MILEREKIGLRRLFRMALDEAFTPPTDNSHGSQSLSWLALAAINNGSVSADSAEHLIFKYRPPWAPLWAEVVCPLTPDITTGFESTATVLSLRSRRNSIAFVDAPIPSSDNRQLVIIDDADRSTEFPLEFGMSLEIARLAVLQETAKFLVNLAMHK